MNVLSVRIGWGYHDDSAVLICNKKVYAIECERLSRIKHNCDQDLATYAYLNNLAEKIIVEKDYAYLNNQGRKIIYKAGINKITKDSVAYLLRAAKIKISEIDLFLGINIPSKVSDGGIKEHAHHKDHAATAFFPSPFKQAAVLVIDVFGASSVKKKYLRETVSFWIGKNRKLKNIITYFSPASQIYNGIYHFYSYHNSIGVFYTDLTIICGFGVYEGQKTMGLSSYGSDRILKQLRQFINIDKFSGVITFRREYIKFLEGMKRSDDFQFKADVAFAAQRILEEAVLFYCNKLYSLTHCENICLAGGLALNSVANGLIIRKTPFKRIFVQPASNDAGLSLGRALNAFYQFQRNRKTDLNFNNYCLGKEYRCRGMDSKLGSFPGINFKKYHFKNELYTAVAELLIQKKIIGWFQGRSEFGPRALGNRSIFCSASDKKMQDILNRVKFREWFRPFAPVVLEEYASEYFDINFPSPHMLIVASVKSKKIPAVTHIDGSARLQTVNIEQNKELYSLIKEYYKKSGIPVLLNTSFNIKGEPIVETPEQAIESFLKSDLDYLVLDNYLIYK